MGKHKTKSRARDRRKKGFGTKGIVTCDTCKMVQEHGVPGKKHRRCGGSTDAPRRHKHRTATEAPWAKGTWR